MKLGCDCESNRPLYFKGYELSDTMNCVNEYEMRLLHAAEWLVDNRSCLRETCENWDWKLTTLWRAIHKDLSSISPELYRCVVKQFKQNVEKRGRVYHGCRSY